MGVTVTKDSYKEVMNALRGVRLKSIDTETTGLEETDRLFAIIIGVNQTEYYFDRRILSDAFLRDPEFKLMIFNTDAAFQNAKFDMRMIGYEGLEVGGACMDIAVLARLVKNNHMVYSLDAQAKRHGWAKDDAVKAYIKKEKLYETRKNFLGEEYQCPRYDWVPIQIMEKYACMDARLTYDLFHEYIAMLPHESLNLWETEKRLTKTLYKIERRGICVDFDKTLRAREFEMGLIREAKAQFHADTGYHYEEDNKKTLIKIFEAAGETIPRTAKGNPSFTKDVLKTFKSPIAQVVRRIRYHEKRVSTYYNAYLNKADRMGIVRASIWQGGTDTGRFSYSDPNLQNIPKEDDEADLLKPFVVRECLVPREGHYFVSMDFDQQEYRMMLDYANEKRLIEEVLAGKDVHQATADLIRIMRKRAKSVNFAALYGAGADKLAQMLGCTLFEAMQILARYFFNLPNVEAFINGVRAAARQRGYVVTWSGRRLHCNDPNFAYAMVNHLIQGGCSDVLREAMNKCDDDNAPMLLQVHDQLLFEPEIESDVKNLELYKGHMESVYKPRNGMGLTVSATHSYLSFAERDMKKGLR